MQCPKVAAVFSCMHGQGPFVSTIYIHDIVAYCTCMDVHRVMYNRVIHSMNIMFIVDTGTSIYYT